MRSQLIRLFYFIGCILGTFALNAQPDAEELHLFDEIQSVEFNRALQEAGYKLAQEVNSSQIDPSDFPGSDTDEGGGGEAENIPISLSFINLSSREYRDDVYEETVTDLNDIFFELEANSNKYSVDFCWSEVASTRSFIYKKKGLRNVVEGWDFAHSQWVKFYGESIKDDLEFSEDIQVFIVDLPLGSAGFSSSFINEDESVSRVVVIDAELILKKLPLKINNKVLAHLICNSLGLRSLWAEDDNIDDTPVHPLQNCGVAKLKGTHVAFVPGMPKELIYNLMDNTAGGDATDLTEGQQNFLVQKLQIIAENSQYDYSTCKNLVVKVEEAGTSEIRTHLAVLPTELKISPNPSSNYLDVIINLPQKENLTLSIYDQSGRLVLTSAISVGRVGQRINVQQLESGMYSLVAIGAKGVVSSQNFIKTN